VGATGGTEQREAADTAAGFFGRLAERRHEPLLKNVTGTMRFDLVDGGRTEHWYLDINKGETEISRKSAPADSIIRADKAFFDDLACGKENAMAAALRGALVLEGKLALLVSFQGLLPGPEGSDTKAAAGGRVGEAR
jgi:putative sterol carrier protein